MVDKAYNMQLYDVGTTDIYIKSKNPERWNKLPYDQLAYKY